MKFRVTRLFTEFFESEQASGVILLFINQLYVKNLSSASL